MALIQSIAGIRGTLGGGVPEGLTPPIIVGSTTAFGQLVMQAQHPTDDAPTIIIGRDARPSGSIISQLVSATLQSLGIHVIDIGLTTTPTIAMSILSSTASGGIMISASHNPQAWNALKLLDHDGEYVSPEIMEKIIAVSQDNQQWIFATHDKLGTYQMQDNAISQHIEAIIALPLVNVAAIRKKKFSIAVDAVHSTGGIAVPQLLKALGVCHVKLLYGEPHGQFPHDPEPLPQHLTALQKVMQQGSYNLGLAVDPDVDRLAVVDENGQALGEEYTLVAVADYILQHTPGNTVSNVSSTSALQVLTQQYGGEYVAAAVGEVHVVAAMKAANAVIGGEGNGGVIYPPLHYGRDALLGIALLLSYLATSKKTISTLKAAYPYYFMEKRKIHVKNQTTVEKVLQHIEIAYRTYPIHTLDGLKIILDNAWILVRKSNTEPVVRMYTEAPSAIQALQLMETLQRTIQQFIQKLS